MGSEATSPCEVGRLPSVATGASVGPASPDLSTYRLLSASPGPHGIHLPRETREPIFPRTPLTSPISLFGPVTRTEADANDLQGNRVFSEAELYALLRLFFRHRYSMLLLMPPAKRRRFSAPQKVYYESSPSYLDMHPGTWLLPETVREEE